MEKTMENEMETGGFRVVNRDCLSSISSGDIMVPTIE